MALLLNSWRKLAPSARLVWLVLVLLYVLVQVGRPSGLLVGPVAWYLTDLICLPLVLSLVLMAHRLAGRPAAWTLPPGHGVAAAVAYAIYFEALLPRFSPGAVADPRDVLCYLLGWVLFELLINRPTEETAVLPNSSFPASS